MAFIAANLNVGVILSGVDSVALGIVSLFLQRLGSQSPPVPFQRQLGMIQVKPNQPTAKKPHCCKF